LSKFTHFLAAFRFKNVSGKQSKVLSFSGRKGLPSLYVDHLKMTSDNAAHKEVVKVNESDNNREAEMKDSREQNETAANQWAKSKLHKSTQLDAASASQVSFAAQRIFTRRDVLLMSFRRQLIWVFPQRLAVGSVACRFGSRRLGSVRSAPRSPAPPRPALPRPALARPALPRPAPLPGVT